MIITTRLEGKGNPITLSGAFFQGLGKSLSAPHKGRARTARFYCTNRPAWPH